MSLTSEGSADSHISDNIVKEKLSSSNKSQTDSGIGQEDFVDISAAQFLATEVSKLTNAIRENVDDYLNLKNKSQSLSNKQSEETTDKVIQSDHNSSSSTSESPSTESQLSSLLMKKPRNKGCDFVREHRNSSSRSVSIEMDGDNLVIVTEELEDSTFADDEQTPPKTSEIVESTSVSSDSTYPSPSSEHYLNMLKNDHKEEETQNQESCPNSNGSVHDSSQCTEDSQTRNNLHHSSNMEKLRSGLDLKLDLSNPGNHGNNIILTTPDISITHDSSGSSCSTPTSGPDSRPPTPFTPPDSPGGSVSSPTSRRDGEFLYAEEPDSPSYNMSFPHNSISYSSTSSPGFLKKSARDQVSNQRIPETTVIILSNTKVVFNNQTNLCDFLI